MKRLAIVFFCVLGFLGNAMAVAEEAPAPAPTEGTPAPAPAPTGGSEPDCN